MKTIVATVVAVMMLGVLAFAGPYFTLENSGMAIAPSLTIGADFSTAVQTPDVGGPRVFGDAHWDLPAQDLNASLGVGFSGVKAELGTLLDFNKKLTKLNEWDISFTIIGYPFSGFKVWGGVSFNFTPSSTWALVPVFGIEGRW